MDILATVKDFAFSWKMVVLLAGITILLLVVFLRPKKVEPFEEEEEDKLCELFFFHTEWCPYCKKARPEWDKFKAPLENTSRDNYKFVFTEVDCDKNEGLAGKYNVVGYPTIKLIKDGKITEYDAKTSASTLNAFVDSCF